MSVKQYGIYLCYPPTVDLRHEGLGRYLASFLSGAANNDGAKFILVCPSWSHESLKKLFESEGVPQDKIEIVSPRGKPLVISWYEFYQTIKSKNKKSSLFAQFSGKLKSIKLLLVEKFLDKLVRAHGIIGLLSLSLLAAILLATVIVSAPVVLLGYVVTLGMFCFGIVKKPVLRLLSKKKEQHGHILKSPKTSSLVHHMYLRMERMEAERMQTLIDALPQILAWYCPTAFWSNFNNIKAPRLMCVPDVVLSDFPIGFSDVGGDRMLTTFKQVQSAIHSGDAFVTYSESVKWNTLVDCFGVRASAITVVHHAPNVLNQWLEVNGFNNNEETSLKYSKSLLISAIKRTKKLPYVFGFSNDEVKFFFYASQFRPNKNVITLLRAYEYLLHTRHIQHKLFLTGNKECYPEIRDFINSHHLENDILCLNGLSIKELAAAYKLSDLAINPSLSEGGCPFTFTEALSVNTPVVMARIPVTEEVLSDPALQGMTLFDPYDWKDMAQRIEWAVNNRSVLLEAQVKTYQQLVKRTWTDVVDEHIAILDRISLPAPVLIEEDAT